MSEIEFNQKINEYHIDLDYTYTGYTSGKLIRVNPVLLKFGRHKEKMRRYLLEVEICNGKIEKFFYYRDNSVLHIIGRNILFERKQLDGSPVNEMLHIYRDW
ncbi:hypothetical protein [Pectobacterium actinidiae]|uniref:hypothetical protein n=1 Tax=Pectobacterium actinidiae TaxID=1507808 RepID=UPI00208BEDEB|nr:hypothetical protein SOASR014_39580 [Pectobacterium carotovorum subsp. carotovorum]GLX43824.1 hypothetical protein Pcaca01_14920 [Pectobacterium carotovorum subsp. carotovorum]